MVPAMLRRPRLPTVLRGPLPALPRPLDAASERWSALRPRTRLLAALMAVALAVAISEARLTAAESRWGGPGVDVLVATEDLSVGAAPDVRAVAFPPAVVPPGAVEEVPEGATLSLALPQGAVLTDSHLDAAGPAAGLDADLRAVPIPVERGWGISAGARVDVWALGVEDEPARLIASGRPVLELSGDGSERQTALVGLGVDEVGSATAGIALGRILLAQTPAP